MKAKEAVKQFEGVKVITRFDLCRMYMNELSQRVNLRVHGRVFTTNETFLGVLKEINQWFVKVCRLLEITPEDCEILRKENEDLAKASMQRAHAEYKKEGRLLNSAT